MVSALNSSPGQAVSVGILTGDIVFFFWAKHSHIMVPFSTRRADA